MQVRKVMAMLGVLTGLLYLMWRVLVSAEGVAPWLTWPLLAAETLLMVIYALDVWATWPDPAPPPPGRRPIGGVAVLITAFREPETAVRTALLACLELQEADEIYLLDDAGRDDLRHLADRYDVTYLSRLDGAGGRSGAIAHGLSRVNADFVLVLSGDQGPRPDLLRRALPLLTDDVAVVQIRHDYANVDSVIHSSRTQHDESWQFDVVSPAADSRGAASWESSGALVRKDAIDGIGGYPVDSHASELVATSRLQAAGWRLRYLDRPLVTGLAPRNLAGFIVQRTGWARGELGLLFTRDSALRQAGLTRAQRLHQLHVAVSHLSAVAYAIVGVCLLVAMTQGMVPMAVSAMGIALLVAWQATVAVGRVAIGRGHLEFGGTVTRNLVSLELRLRALWKVIVRDQKRMAPPRGGGSDDVTQHLPALLGFVVALELLFALRLLDAVVGWPLDPLTGAELIATLLWAAATASVSLRVVGAFSRRRQERAHHRVGVDYFGSLDGSPCWVVDLSAGGAGVVTTLELDAGAEVLLSVDVGYAVIDVSAVVRSVVPNQDGARRRLGLQLVDVDDDALDEILRCVSLGSRTKRQGASAQAVQVLPEDVVDLTIADDEGYDEATMQVAAVDRVGERIRLDLRRIDDLDDAEIRPHRRSF